MSSFLTALGQQENWLRRGADFHFYHDRKFMAKFIWSYPRQLNLGDGLFHFTHVEDIGKIGTCKMPSV
jgi:hypothetical protein